MSTHKVEVEEAAHVEVALPEEVAAAVEACVEPTAPADAACSPLWMRLAIAVLYLGIAVACAVGGVSFFIGDQSTLSDWVFGTFAFGLAIVAGVGVKESLFPSDWRPE
jgi:hypothetical protein